MRKRFLFILTTILILLINLHVYAQNDIHLASVNVDLWPEYDQPTMLVIYHIALPANNFKPVDLTIMVPAAVDRLNALAARQADGALYNMNYTQNIKDGWKEIHFTATTPEVQLEYYDPGLSRSGYMRSFTYKWPANYQVDSFVVVVQRPIDASLMEVSTLPYPEPGREPNKGKQAEDGMTYYTYPKGKTVAGKPFQVEISYYKHSDELSSSSLPLQSISPINGNTVNQDALSSMLLYVFGGGGLLLIVGGAIWYWISTRQKTFRPDLQRSRVYSEDTEPLNELKVYCHHCGKRAAPGDRFCRACGAELRNV